MTTVDFERIRVALSALKPDVKKPWGILDRLPYIHATDDPNAKPYSTPVVGRFDYMESADYIMACNPAAMSDILAYVDALKAERDELLAALKPFAATDLTVPIVRDTFGFDVLRARVAIARAEGEKS